MLKYTDFYTLACYLGVCIILLGSLAELMAGATNYRFWRVAHTWLFVALMVLLYATLGTVFVDVYIELWSKL